MTLHKLVRRLSLPLVLAVLAALTSGCVWGVVRNAETGAPIAGAEISISSEYNVRRAATDGNGFYSFDPALGSSALPGEASFFVSAPGFEAVKEKRSIDYPGASFADASSFRSMQVFDLAPRPGGYRDTVQGFYITFPPDWAIWAAPNYARTPDQSLAEASPASDIVGDIEWCETASGGMSELQTPETWWSALGKKYDVLASANAQVAGRTATRSVYEYDFATQTVKGVLYLFQRDSQAWAIDCLVNVDKFKADMDMFDGVAKSFQFTR